MGDGSTEAPIGDEDCSCERGVVSLQTVVEEGFSGADLVASASNVEVELDWSALAETPSTSLTITSALRDGPVFDEVGGCCGTFICGPCPEGVTVPVQMSVISADGRLAEDVAGTVTGILNDPVLLRSEWIDVSDGDGGWVAEMFQSQAEPFDVEQIRIATSYSDEEITTYIEAIGSVEGGSQNIWLADSFGG